jgi:hypothetical protein
MPIVKPLGSKVLVLIEITCGNQGNIILEPYLTTQESLP